MNYDIFISYATDDWQKARDIGATLHQASLTVYLDVPLDPERSPLEVFVENVVRWAKAALRGPAAKDPRRSDAEIVRQIRNALGQSQCVLVLWSRSHRGSRWASREIDIFENEHPDRPIFVIRVDRTPWARPTTQWVSIDGATALTHGSLASAVRDLKIEIVGEAPRLFDVILRPSRWTNAVQQRRWGTTSVELLALAGEMQSGQRVAMAKHRASVLRSAAVAGLLTTGVAMLLTLGGFDRAAHLSAISQASRHVMLTMTAGGTFTLLLSVQTDLPVLIAAVTPAGGIALLAQLLWSWWTPTNGGAGPGAGAALGAIGGGVLFHSWQQRGDAEDPSTSRWRLTASVLVTLTLVAAFVILFVPDQPANGQLHSLALVTVIAAAMLLPVLGLWREVSRTGRAREVLIKGSASSALIFAVILVLAWLFDRAIVRLDQQALSGGAVAGLLVGLCAGAIALAPGALFGDRVDRHPRVVASVAVVSLSLIALYPLLVRAGAPADFVRDVWNANAAYPASFVVSLGAAATWIGVRRAFAGE